MGNKNTVVKNNCIEELNNIDENNLDISNIAKLQIKAIKEMNSKIDKLQKKNKQRCFMLCLKLMFVTIVYSNLII